MSVKSYLRSALNSFLEYKKDWIITKTNIGTKSIVLASGEDALPPYTMVSFTAPAYGYAEVRGTGNAGWASCAIHGKSSGLYAWNVPNTNHDINCYIPVRKGEVFSVYLRYTADGTGSKILYFHYLEGSQ